MEQSPKIVERQFTLIGVLKHASWEDDLLPIIQASKEELSKRMPEIKNRKYANVSIKYFFSETGAQDGYDYLEAVEVEEKTLIPDGLTMRVLQNSLYAVFNESDDEAGTIGKYARKTWLPQSGYHENYDVFGDLELSRPRESSHEFWLPITK